jgi:hypothetical protein
MEAEQIIGLEQEPREVPPQLTVVEKVYYRTGNEDPTEIDTRYSRTLSNAEQVYERRLTVGQEWQAIPTGWINRCAMLIVKNLEGTNEADNKAVELGYGKISLFEIIPRESFRCTPKIGLERLFIRCIGGKAKVRVYLIPD